MALDCHTAPAWANPDTKRECVCGYWDVYCACCGLWCAYVASAGAPASLSCMRCQRTAQLATGALSAAAAPTQSLL